MTEETNHSSDALDYGDTTLFCAKFRVFTNYSVVLFLMFSLSHCDDDKCLKDFFFRPTSFKWY